MTAIPSMRFAAPLFTEPSVTPHDECYAQRALATSGVPLDTPDGAGKTSRALFRWAKPTPAEAVTLQAAAQALERVFERLGANRDVQNPPDGLSTLRNVEKQPMETLMIAATLITVRSLGNAAEAKGKALEIMSDVQKAARQQEVRDLREQVEKAIEQQNKAKKAGIFGAICDWVVAAVEVVTGVAKIVGGALTGNVMTVAGGAMDLMAGTAGLVKAFSSTMALIDKDNAEKWKSIASTAGKIQLAFEIAGAVVDITSAARNLVVTKAIPKVAKTVMQEGGERLLTAAAKEGTKVAAETAIKKVTEQIVNKVSKEAVDLLGREALEKIVQTAVETAFENMVKRAAKKGIEAASKKVTGEIVDAIRKQVIERCISLATNFGIKAAAVSVTEGAKTFTSGLIDLEKAKLERDIKKLMVEQWWLQAIFDMYQRSKKDVEEQIKDLIQAQGVALEGGVRQMQAGAALAVRNAASMGHVAAAAV